MNTYSREWLVRTFGPVLDASGVRNFYGQGWWHTPLLWLLGFRLKGRSTFVSKTTTAEQRDGNTPLVPGSLLTRDWKPRSVVIDSWGRHTLNAWGLSGPGAKEVLSGLARRAEQGVYPALQISFMPVGATRDQLLAETRKFASFLRVRLGSFARTRLALQFNASCPNTGHDEAIFLELLSDHLDILGEFELPVLVKESVDTPFELMRAVADHPVCSGIVTTNTVKFGNLPDRIPWEEIYGTADPEKSPLAGFGVPGGYSGPHLLPIVEDRVRRYRDSGYQGYINAGGGIRTAADARRLREAGADSIFLGITASYRPWNTGAIIREARSWYPELKAQAAA